MLYTALGISLYTSDNNTFSICRIYVQKQEACVVPTVFVTTTLTYLIYLLYFLTSRSTVLLEKSTDSQVVKKFPAVYGTRMFITAFTSAHHLSLS
jgi:hypothetical protein